MEPSLSFFEQAEENFLRAIAASDQIVKYYRLLHFTICLKFAGPVFVDSLTSALSHLEIEKADRSDLTICVWDSFSTKTAPIEFPWSQYLCDIRGEVRGYNSDRIYTLVDIHTKVLNLFDREKNLALYWIKDHRQLPWWAGGSPFQFIFHWWLRLNGFQLTHSAAVGRPEGGVLLAGKSGSGKSTTALSCLKAKMKVVSEDYCFLGDLPDISAFNLYNSVKIDDTTLNWFPEFKKEIANVNRKSGEKALLYCRENILPKLPLKALLLPKIRQTDESSLEPIDFSKAIGSLSISTLWQLPRAGTAAFLHLKRISEALPCYLLNLGRDLSEPPRLIESLL